MAELNPPLHQSKLPTPTFGTAKPQDQHASAKFLSNFLYKTIFLAIFLSLLPLFPSQAPESMNQSVFARSWELIHLLVFGIAISYGLFSHRNTEPELEKEAASKADSPQSYLPHILHVSSVFDDYEVGSQHRPLDESKIQTWSSQYYRKNHVVVVKKEGTNVSQATNKPLHLPIRSLKSCSQASGSLDSRDKFIDGHSGSANGIEEPRIFDALNSKNETKGSSSAVLPSPIQWRSRSGRMEVKDELASGTCRSPPPPSRSPPSKFPSFHSPVTHTPSTPPKRLSSSCTLFPETRASGSEDMGRKKSFCKSTPPPPPPPPPPFLGHYSYSPVSEKNMVMKSLKDELKDLSRRGREGFQSANNSGFDSLMSARKPRNVHAESSSVRRSVRTVGLEEIHGAMPDQGIKTSVEPSFGYEARQLSLATRSQSEIKNELMEKVIVSTEDSDSDDDDAGECSDKEVSNSVAEAGPDDSEVDKKADEFIAKFREQIRLQRIEAIKKSSGQRNLRNPK